MDYTGSSRMRKRRAKKKTSTAGKKKGVGSIRREANNPTEIPKIRAKDLTRTKQRKNRNLT